jgi:hypothetical protein
MHRFKINWLLSKETMLNFCTLFDSNYLTRGVAMFDSLKQHCREFHLYIFAFDDTCYEVLRKLSLDNITVINLSEFEDERLLRIKPFRTQVEYCWTCTPAIILFCMKKFSLTHCTYVDADLYFYADPEILISEMGDKSVLITEHRYSRKYDLTVTSGRYCVQFITFKRDGAGLAALHWWHEACLEWCYARFEDGKFGDQKYLDDWTVRFKSIHVLQNLGGGMAPWNIQQYKVFYKKGKLFGREKKTGKQFEVIFYHFHGVKFYKNDIIGLNVYKLTAKQKKLFYRPYIQYLEKWKNKIFQLDSSFNPHGVVTESPEVPYGFGQYIKLFFNDILFTLHLLARVLLFRNILLMKERTQNYYYRNNFIK